MSAFDPKRTLVVHGPNFDLGHHDQNCSLVLWFRRLRHKLLVIPAKGWAGLDRRGDLGLGVAATGGFAILFLPSRPFDIFADNLLRHECQQLAGRIFGRIAQRYLSQLSVVARAFVAAAPAPQTQYRAFQ